MAVLEEHFRAHFLFLDKFKSLVKITWWGVWEKNWSDFIALKRREKSETDVIAILSILLSVSQPSTFNYFSLLNSKTSVSVEESSKIFGIPLNG
jgi:hypothetical protein